MGDRQTARPAVLNPGHQPTHSLTHQIPALSVCLSVCLSVFLPPVARDFFIATFQLRTTSNIPSILHNCTVFPLGKRDRSLRVLHYHRVKMTVNLKDRWHGLMAEV